MNINLGDEVTDKITGFRGVAISRVEYLTGCVQFGLAAKVKADGTIPETVYLDESRLEPYMPFDPTDAIESLGFGIERQRPGGPSVQVPAREHP
jgi:hypothetical protein